MGEQWEEQSKLNKNQIFFNYWLTNVGKQSLTKREVE